MAKKKNRMQFIYTGVALNSKDQKRYAYINTESGKMELYKTKIWNSETVGSVIEATKTETGVDAPYEFKGSVNQGLWPDYLDSIAEWSIRERASLETLRLVSEGKKDHPESINGLITQIKGACWSLNARQRKNFALWIYNQLT